MTVLNTLLDNFDDLVRERTSGEPAAAEASVGTLSEADRLAAYEDGYRSGWDDCVEADREEVKRVSAELARNLSDISFSYHEARTQLLSELEELLGVFFSTVMPRLTGTAVATRVVDDVLDLAGDALDQPCEIVVASSEVATVRALLPEVVSLPVHLVEETALAPGQAYLRLGAVERKYDLSDMTDRLLAALSSSSSKSMREMPIDIAGK